MKMRFTRHAVAVVSAGAILGMLTACGSDANDVSVKPAVTVTVPAAMPSPSVTEKSADELLKEIQASNSAARESLEAEVSEAAEADEVGTDEVPDVVGMNHAEALTLLHSAGFLVNEEDAQGDRWIIDNSNWKVCRQVPGAGSHPTTIRVAIYSVKNDESC
ncbi:PASTA domain-containing protein [Actinacidiphila glaucinigra]|uniref:PASTA domain-containing protein n=1 Tax=Actinacidiphila glaucinigra TaxID=235986 RepID=UPI0037CA45DE